MLFNEPKLLKLVASSRERGGFDVSVLFNEPKLLKSAWNLKRALSKFGFSALQRAEIAEMLWYSRNTVNQRNEVSVLFNEPKLLKCANRSGSTTSPRSVSVLFNEPKLLKYPRRCCNRRSRRRGFSALQRAEIAEIDKHRRLLTQTLRFSALQRAEIAEIWRSLCSQTNSAKFQCSSTSRNC